MTYFIQFKFKQSFTTRTNTILIGKEKNVSNSLLQVESDIRGLIAVRGLQVFLLPYTAERGSFKFQVLATF